MQCYIIIIVFFFVLCIILIYTQFQEKYKSLYDNQVENFSVAEEGEEILNDNNNINNNYLQLSNGYTDLNNFINSVLDFRAYSPIIFQELINSINIFAYLIDTALSNDKFCNYYYQIADNKRYDVLNNLHSFIYSMPTNIEKLNNSMEQLNNILTIYINKIYNKCNTNTKINGFNMYARQINTGPREYNSYNDKNFSPQFY